MSIIEFSKPPEEDKKPSFEPKRIIHRPKPVSRAGEGKRRRASIFRRKPAAPPAAQSQPEPRAEIAKPDSVLPRDDQTHPPRTGKGINPGLRLRALESAGKNAPPIYPPGESRPLSKGEQRRRAYWDVSAGLSLVVNVILLAVLLLMAFQIKTLKTTVNGLLSGLYNNFVEMDNASIATTIMVNAEIPVSFMLPVQQDTTVRLTQDTLLNDAKVVINAGLFNINAPADVTLRKDTLLPIALTLNIPVQTTIPISIPVPVIIPLSQTQLHNPFAGLQNTIRPLYCIFNKNAQYPEGIYVCEDHDIPTPTPGVP